MALLSLLWFLPVLKSKRSWTALRNPFKEKDLANEQNFKWSMFTNIFARLLTDIRISQALETWDWKGRPPWIKNLVNCWALTVVTSMAVGWDWQQRAVGNWCMLAGKQCAVGALRSSANVACHPKHWVTPLKPHGDSRPYRWIDDVISLWECRSKSVTTLKVYSSNS